MQTRFTCKSAGKFSRHFILALAVSGVTKAWCADLNLRPVQRPLESSQTEWRDYEANILKKERKDRVDGISYVLSGTLALVGGLVGQGLSDDPLEKGVYTLFQTIGVASIGYGFFTWNLGDNDRMFYESLASAPGLASSDRAAVMRSYYSVKSDRERRQKFVRALTHGLIAGLNFYGATQQKNDSVKNALIFLGSVNSLAVLSYTF